MTLSEWKENKYGALSVVLAEAAAEAEVRGDPDLFSDDEYGLLNVAKFAVHEFFANDTATGLIGGGGGGGGAGGDAGGRGAGDWGGTWNGSDVIVPWGPGENGSAVSSPQIITAYPSAYSQLSVILLALVMTAMMVVIVIGNMLVVIAIATENNLTSIQNWFIASLAVADMLIGLVVMPFSLSYELMGYWMFGELWCEIHSAVDVFLCTSSIMNICLISLDRYWSITRAIAYLNARTPKKVLIMIVTVWLLSGLISIPPLLGWKQDEDLSWFHLILNERGNRSQVEFLQYIDESGTLAIGNFTATLEKVVYPQCRLSQDFGYVLYSAFGSFYIPSCIMVFVYIKIYFAARERARRNIKMKKKSRRKSNRPKPAKISLPVPEPTSPVAKPEPVTHSAPPQLPASAQSTVLKGDTEHSGQTEELASTKATDQPHKSPSQAPILKSGTCNNNNKNGCPDGPRSLPTKPVKRTRFSFGANEVEANKGKAGNNHEKEDEEEAETEQEEEEEEEEEEVLEDYENYLNQEVDHLIIQEFKHVGPNDYENLLNDVKKGIFQRRTCTTGQSEGKKARTLPQLKTGNTGSPTSITPTSCDTPISTTTAVSPGPSHAYGACLSNSARPARRSIGVSTRPDNETMPTGRHGSAGEVAERSSNSDSGKVRCVKFRSRFRVPIQCSRRPSKATREMMDTGKLRRGSAPANNSSVSDKNARDQKSCREPEIVGRAKKPPKLALGKLKSASPGLSAPTPSSVAVTPPSATSVSTGRSVVGTPAPGSQAAARTGETDAEKEKKRLARKKERRATLILGLIMGSFIACWLPFFFLYSISPICPLCEESPSSPCCVQGWGFSFAFWLGYSNSCLNPVIYTIFNKDFRRAFKRILFK